jgi:hypothetical protein
MQHIKTILDKYKGLSMAQFNHIKANNITDFELVGDLSDFDNDLLQYKDKQGKLITVFSNGEVYQD